MAEKTIIVCDVCGEPAVERVTLRTGNRTLQKDLCATHLAELVAGARPAKRGRPPKKVSPSTAVAKASRRASSGPRRRASQKQPAAKPARKRITDPAILEKRRAALAEARQALAEKRAAEKGASAVASS
ncbi:MAG: hypothetical protein M3O94_06395 [Actinomycetota bacterium]|nr:hypothetical protein [Actinomycetota bacterium]